MKNNIIFDKKNKGILSSKMKEIGFKISDVFYTKTPFIPYKFVYYNNDRVMISYNMKDETYETEGLITPEMQEVIDFTIDYAKMMNEYQKEQENE